MKLNFLKKIAVLISGIAMVLNAYQASAQSSGRKVDKAFYDDMKVIDPSYAANIKMDEKGVFTDYNKAGIAEGLKKNYENKVVKISEDKLQMPKSDKEKQMVLQNYPQRIQYLQTELSKIKSSVDIYNARYEIARMQTVLTKLNNK